MMGLVFGEQLIRALPQDSQRRWRIGWLAATVLLTVVFYTTTLQPQADVTARQLQAAELAFILSATGLLVFLPTAGLIHPRGIGTAAGEMIGNWGPVFFYLLCAGTCLEVVCLYRPLVCDPVLFRMDLSLGFSPCETIAGWEIHQYWIEWISEHGYPLLGIFIAGVAARLHLAGAIGQLRRCLIGYMLVGILGVTCYWFVPAVSPVKAFPGLLAQAGGTPAQQALATHIRRAIVNGPDQMPSNRRNERNTMPSLHTAFALVALAAAWNWRRRFFWFCLPVGVLQIVTTMTLCVHYLVDLIAAVPLVMLCWWLADRSTRFSFGTAPAGLRVLAMPVNQRRRLSAVFVALLVGLVMGFVWWGRHAPISPWLAWFCVLIFAGIPAIVGLRLNAQIRQD